MGDFWSVLKDLLHMGLPQLLAGIIGILAGVKAIRKDLAEFHAAYRTDRAEFEKQLKSIESRVQSLEIDIRFLAHDVGNRIVKETGMEVLDVGPTAGHRPTGQSGPAPIGTQ